MKAMLVGVALVGVCLTVPAHAQNDFDIPVGTQAEPEKQELQGPAIRPSRSEFLERNYIFYNLPAIGPEANKPLFFEAQVAPHFYFYNGLLKADFPQETARWLHSGSLSMIVRLRMVGDASTPVRPVSFMPRFNYQAFFFTKEPTENTKPGGRLRMLALRASLGHHSNGQQYCRFSDRIRIGDPTAGSCPAVDVDGPPDLQNLNFRSGDFATDFLQFGVHRAWIRLDEGYESGRFAIGAVAELNPLWLKLPGHIDEEQHAMYGPSRLRLEADLGRQFRPCHLPDGRARLSASIEVFSETAPSVPRYRAYVEAAYTPEWWNGLGLFVRYFQGQDYLNILYLRPAVRTVQFGAVWDLSGHPNFSFKPGAP